MNNIRIVLSDSHFLCRKGMHYVLSGQEGYTVIGETHDNDNLYDYLSNKTPDVVFVGITDDYQKDLNVIYHIKRNLPSISVILVLNEDEVDTVTSAIACGISAYVTRDTDRENLLGTVESITKGYLPIISTMLVPDVASAILDNFSWVARLKSDLRAYLMELSSEEKEILTGFSSGMAIEQVALNAGSDKHSIVENIKSIRQKCIANYISRMLVENAQMYSPILQRIRNMFQQGMMPGKYL